MITFMRHIHQLFSVGHKKSYDKLSGGISVNTNIVHQRTSLQFRFHFAK